MSTTQFITRQQMKYYWKVVMLPNRNDVSDDRLEVDDFWQYEQTPRTI